jgi:gamma-glutamyltranspeptidase
MTVDCHDRQCREHPPNGQGIAALIALAILDGLVEADGSAAVGSTAYDDPSRAHNLIEAVRLGAHASVLRLDTIWAAVLTIRNSHRGTD